MAKCFFELAVPDEFLGNEWKVVIQFPVTQEKEARDFANNRNIVLQQEQQQVLQEQELAQQQQQQAQQQQQQQQHPALHVAPGAALTPIAITTT